MCAHLFGALVCNAVVLSAQVAATHSPTWAAKIDSLAHSPGPRWAIAHSAHFNVYVEKVSGAFSTRAILDSLEAAWTHDSALIGTSVPQAPPVSVFVTASRTRFSAMLSPQNRGVTTWTPEGFDLIILIHNDSVRAYTRHEVMHVISRRAWCQNARSAYWLVEGLATFADGRCQATTIDAAAREVLARAPATTIQDVTRKFLELAQDSRTRAGAYVLAGTLTGYLWETRGAAGVKALWQGTDTLSTEPSRTTTFLVDPTDAWHAYVKRVAGGRPGITDESLRRFGCG